MLQKKIIALAMKSEIVANFIEKLSVVQLFSTWEQQVVQASLVLALYASCFA
jgi:hypothetical protein